jgi:hypothetical protein
VNDIADSRIVDRINGIEVNIPAAIILKQFGFDVDSFWPNFISSIVIWYGEGLISRQGVFCLLASSCLCSGG